MKNLQVYYGAKLIEFIGGLWVSDEFKVAFEQKHHFLTSIIDRACAAPIFFYDPTDPVERSHFSTMWRHIPLRHYHNPVVNDLYYLHELSHLANMNWLCYTNETDFSGGAADMKANELLASLDSECFVYLYYPTLRAKTFDFEIWVDRFIKQGATDTPDWLIKVTEERKSLVIDRREPTDDIERYIAHYADQNEAWTHMWKDNFYKINRQVNLMNTLYSLTKKNFTRDCITDIVRFFVEDNTTDGVPFRREAQLFTDYLGNSVKTEFKV